MPMNAVEFSNQLVKNFDGGMSLHHAIMLTPYSEIDDKSRDGKSLITFVKKYQTITNSTMDLDELFFYRAEIIIYVEGLADDFDITTNPKHMELHNLTV